jgi:phosphoglycerol transferase MdoB-like AlkP superfamily enzyme
VADGPLLDAAHRAFTQAREPFFGFVFTSSNHTPFEFPDGEITLHEQPKGTVLNAVKYADHALGRFFEQAQKAPYWKDTVFLVVADHNSRVYGDTLVPVKRFHIPGLILGGPVQPGVIAETASQIDLGPTLISLLGLQGRHPMIGRDLTQPAVRALPGRAVMQFDKSQAYMENNEGVVLRPDLPPTLLRHDPATGAAQPAGEPPADLVRKALAQALFTPLAYRERWHTNAAP